MEYQNNHEYTSKGVGTAALTTGIIGTVGAALGGGLGLLGGMGGIGRTGDDQYITRHEMNLLREIAAKDSEIALIKSEQNTEIKIADIYERIMTRVNADARAQADWNATQAVYNATNTAGISCLRNQVEQLQSLTALRIPNTSVCPGWGDVKVTPVTPTT